VSDYGFRSLGGQLDHQATWSKSVFEVYQDASLPWEWTPILAKHCAEIGIEFMSSPYDVEAVAHLDPYVNAYKVGSGDVNWLEELAFIALMGKPVIIATGASTLDDVHRAMTLLTEAGVPIVLMQCNTNYTGEESNFDNLNLNVLTTFAQSFPKAILGLSDHSKGHVAVLGAVSLGARVIEKHFTDDQSRLGPDHSFSLNPNEWQKMVVETRILERCLGNGIKIIEPNEEESRIVQRRGLRYSTNLKAGSTLKKNDLIALRPLTINAIDPWESEDLIGRKIRIDVEADQVVTRNDFE
jgi:N-acetylneuraminate synthase